MATAYLAFGSNLGDKRAAIETAIERLAAMPGITIADVSPLYRTPPWGKTDQDWFLNAAARAETLLAPHALLDACLAVEAALGRRRAERWGPRRIDIDIIAYDSLTLSDARLTLPHRHLLERAFVLVPLAAIAPDLVIHGRTVEEALRRLDARGIAPEPS